MGRGKAQPHTGFWNFGSHCFGSKRRIAVASTTGRGPRSPRTDLRAVDVTTSSCWRVTIGGHLARQRDRLLLAPDLRPVLWCSEDGTFSRSTPQSGAPSRQDKVWRSRNPSQPSALRDGRETTDAHRLRHRSALDSTASHSTTRRRPGLHLAHAEINTATFRRS
jgi:hypothetical protein